MKTEIGNKRYLHVLKTICKYTIASFISSEMYSKAGDKLFIRACCNRISGNSLKLKEGRFRLYIRQVFFTVRVVKY